MRAAEWERREQRIKASMDRMGDVIKKNTDAEKVFEAKLMRDALKKDKESEAREYKQKEAARMRDVNMIQELNEQIVNKKKQREFEQKQNAEYIKMVISQDERDKRNQKDADTKA